MSDANITDREIREWWTSGASGGADVHDLMIALGETDGSEDEIRAARGRIAIAVSLEAIAARIRRRDRTVTVLIELAAIVVVALAVWL